MEAWYYKNLENSKVQCFLCPHNCIVHPEKAGLCGVRVNRAGKLQAETYGNVSAINPDPIEKKPLYHFYPGRIILSIGGYGCNLFCNFCQNCTISQIKNISNLPNRYIQEDQLIEQALHLDDNIGLAYTYNEPSVWYEFMYNLARQAKEQNLKNVMVSNGYISEKPLRDILPLMDAFNIDLKGFSAEFYKSYTKSNLKHVLRTLEIIRAEGAHLEITHLVVTNLNDSLQEFTSMVKWIKNNLGRDVPLHISRYFPNYKLNEKATRIEILNSFYDIARQELDYVYLGNVAIPGTENTYCPSCKTLIVDRERYRTTTKNLTSDNKCSVCKTPIPIRN